MESVTVTSYLQVLKITYVNQVPRTFKKPFELMANEKYNLWAIFDLPKYLPYPIFVYISGASLLAYWLMSTMSIGWKLAGHL